MSIVTVSGDDGDDELVERCDQCRRAMEIFEAGMTYIIAGDRVRRLCPECATLIRTSYGYQGDV